MFSKVLGDVPLTEDNKVNCAAFILFKHLEITCLTIVLDFIVHEVQAEHETRTRPHVCGKMNGRTQE